MGSRLQNRGGRRGREEEDQRSWPGHERDDAETAAAVAGDELAVNGQRGHLGQRAHIGQQAEASFRRLKVAGSDRHLVVMMICRGEVQVSVRPAAKEAETLCPPNVV